MHEPSTILARWSQLDNAAGPRAAYPGTLYSRAQSRSPFLEDRTPVTRRLPVVLAVIGALVLIASVISAMVVRSVDTATVALPERPEASVVVTEPGVLSAVAPTVTVRATTEGQEPVVLAIGRSSEVEAWLDDAEHARVVGLSSWEELSVEVTAGTPAPDITEEPTGEPAEEPSDGATQEPAEEVNGLPNPAGSDLWVAEASGTGEVELSWEDRPGRWSLVAATDGTGPAPLLELEWGRSVSTPWLLPGIIVGALLLLAGGAMLVLDGLARREQRQRDEARQRQALEWTPTGGGPVATDTLSYTDTDPGTGERLSRRQIRELERAVAEDERRRRRGEVVPPVPQAGDGAVTDEEPDFGVPAQTWAEEPLVADDEPAEETSELAPPESELEPEPEPEREPEPEPELELEPEPEFEPEQESESALEPELAPEPADALEIAPAAESESQTAAESVDVPEPESATSARPGEPAQPAVVPVTLPGDDNIPADGSTPRRPAPAAAEPRGPRAWWARRQAAAGSATGTPTPTQPPAAGVTTPEPPAAESPAASPAAESLAAEQTVTERTATEPAIGSPTTPPATAPDAPETEAETGPGDYQPEPETPSWRSVWGFGGATPREDRPTDDTTDDDTTDEGKEAR